MMSAMHLDEDSYRRLLGGATPPAEARALAAHLATGCEACEAFLAGRNADGLDGAVDAALSALAAASGEAGNDLEFARILGRLRADRRLPRRAAALGVAAAVLLAGVAGLIVPRGAPRPPPWEGEKGSAARVVPLRLRFLVLTPRAGAPPAVERGLPGQRVARAASLQFEVELGRAAEVALARAAGGAPEIFFQARLPAGRTLLSIGGRPAAYPLGELAGPQRFLALASAAAIEPADVARAARLGAAAAPPEGPAISVAQVDVEVR